jgi:hypothetical protein
VARGPEGEGRGEEGEELPGRHQGQQFGQAAFGPGGRRRANAAAGDGRVEGIAIAHLVAGRIRGDEDVELQVGVEGRAATERVGRGRVAVEGKAGGGPTSSGSPPAGRCTLTSSQRSSQE